MSGFRCAAVPTAISHTLRQSMSSRESSTSLAVVARASRTRLVSRGAVEQGAVAQGVCMRFAVRYSGKGIRGH